MPNYSIPKVGIDFSNLSNPQPINLSFPTTASEMITEIPKKANEVTGNYLGLGVLIVLFIMLIKLLTDEFEGFRYSFIRGTCISSLVCTIFGLFCLNVGYFTEYYHIVIFGVIAFATLIWIVIEET